MKFERFKKSFDHCIIGKDEQSKVRGGLDCCPIPPDDPPKEQNTSVYFDQSVNGTGG